VNIELHIGELILRGVPYRERHRIAAAIEAELVRLLDEGGLPPSLAGGGTVPQVRVDDLRPAVDAKPGAIGAQVAVSIYRHLSGGEGQPGLAERSTE
jgi:hypothetical protein